MKLKELLDLVSFGNGSIYIILEGGEQVGGCPVDSIGKYFEGLKKARDDYGDYYIKEIYPMISSRLNGFVIDISKEMKGYTILLCEDDDFKFELLKRDYGTNVYLTNKTEKYSIYEVFDSFLWFNEYVSKLFNAAEILDLNDLDFNDYETAKEIIDLEYVKTRIENFFKFITTDIKYTIEENR